MASPPLYLIGQQFGQLTVLDVRWANEGSGKKPTYKALCRCSCGTEKEVFTTAVRYGHTSSCGCSREHYKGLVGRSSPHFKGHGEIGRSFWTRCEQGAAARGLLFMVSIEYAWDLYLLQDRRCALSGEPIFFGSLTTKAKVAAPTTASLDRINPADGYLEGNVQWVHKVVNLMRHTMTVEEFIGWCRTVRDHRV